MLLNMDRKLVTKIVAGRFQASLGGWLVEGQRGFVRGRRIEDSLAWVTNVIEAVRSEDAGAQLWFMDQEKAYDQVNRDYLWIIGRRMGWGERCISMLRRWMEGSHFQITFNGWTGDRLSMQRGLPQGDPLSPVLYVMLLEPLLEKLLGGRGLVVAGRRWHLGVFVNNLVVGVGSQEDGVYVRRYFENYQRVSGARLNW